MRTSEEEIVLLRELRARIDACVDEDGDGAARERARAQSQSVTHDVGSQIETTMVVASMQYTESASRDGATQCSDESWESTEEEFGIDLGQLERALAACEQVLLDQSVCDPLDDVLAALKPPSS